VSDRSAAAHGLLEQPNPGRALHATVDGVVYARHPVRTHLITADDDPLAVVQRHALPLPAATTYLAISERMVAITQGRSHPISGIRPGRLANFLWPHVTQTSYGIGLRSPQTMQLAISEVGPLRILMAAAVSAITRPFGIHGLFYRVAGRRAAAIDGPTSYTIPPYNDAATLGPRDPSGVARSLAAAVGVPVAIIDANDAGCAVLGASPGLDPGTVERLFADNPLGQAGEQTPIAVVTTVEWPAGTELPPVPRRRLAPPSDPLARGRD
jgi:hypothetical protein